MILTLGDRSNPSELIHLLRDLASYEPLTAARYVAKADAVIVELQDGKIIRQIDVEAWD